MNSGVENRTKNPLASLSKARSRIPANNGFKIPMTWSEKKEFRQIPNVDTPKGIKRVRWNDQEN